MLKSCRLSARSTQVPTTWVPSRLCTAHAPITVRRQRTQQLGEDEHPGSSLLQPGHALLDALQVHGPRSGRTSRCPRPAGDAVIGRGRSRRRRLLLSEQPHALLNGIQRRGVVRSIRQCLAFVSAGWRALQHLGRRRGLLGLVVLSQACSQAFQPGVRPHGRGGRRWLGWS